MMRPRVFSAPAPNQWCRRDQPGSVTDVPRNRPPRRHLRTRRFPSNSSHRMTEEHPPPEGGRGIRHATPPSCRTSRLGHTNQPALTHRNSRIRRRSRSTVRRASTVRGHWWVARFSGVAAWRHGNLRKRRHPSLRGVAHTRKKATVTLFCEEESLPPLRIVGHVPARGKEMWHGHCQLP